VDWYINHGIDVAAFTDHHSTLGAEEAMQYVNANNLEFTVLLGQEYTSSKVHLNLYGITETIVPIGGSTYTEHPFYMNVSDAIQYTKSNGGYVIVNHYRVPTGDDYTFEELRDWGVDGFEIVNGGNPQAPEIRQFCLANNLICVSATDVHGNEPIEAFMRVELANASEITVDSVFAALGANAHQAISIEPPSISVPSLFTPIDQVYTYFMTMTDWQILSWLGWITGSWVLCLSLIRHERKKPRMQRKQY
jgi:hypothetical protein